MALIAKKDMEQYGYHYKGMIAINEPLAVYLVSTFNIELFELFPNNKERLITDKNIMEKISEIYKKGHLVGHEKHFFSYEKLPEALRKDYFEYSRYNVEAFIFEYYCHIGEFSGILDDSLLSDKLPDKNSKQLLNLFQSVELLKSFAIYEFLLNVHMVTEEELAAYLPLSSDSLIELINRKQNESKLKAQFCNHKSVPKYITDQVSNDLITYIQEMPEHKSVVEAISDPIFINHIILTFETEGIIHNIYEQFLD